MEINKILESVAKGEISRERAKELIHELYARPGVGGSSRPTEQKGQAPSVGEGLGDASSGDSIKRAFERVKKSRNIDDFIKVSSGLVHQIAENMPEKIERFQENVLSDMNIAGFSANIKGISSKFSLFRSFQVNPDCTVSDNQAVGCQWFAVQFDKKAEIVANKFTAVQLTEVAVVQSNFSRNTLSLSRVSNVTLREAKVESNRLSRSTLSDAAMTESDFTDNRLSKSEFAQTVFNGSRVSKNSFAASTFRECDFESCDIQGVEFENCRFEECAFNEIVVSGGASCRIADKTVVGKTFTACKTFAELLAAIEQVAETGAEGAAAGEEVKTPAASVVPPTAGAAGDSSRRSESSRPGERQQKPRDMRSAGSHPAAKTGSEKRRTPPSRSR
jgi:uncharacterized protein YjbI with pentapeptide repeats